jgi:predicted DNA-binding protein
MAHSEPIRFHVVFPPDLHESLKDMAADEGGRSVASLIREACEERVKRQEPANA